MASRTAWTAGLGVGYTWTTAINTTDLASLASGSSVLSSVASIANQTAQDIYADLSVRMTISSTAIGAGAFFALYLAALLDDGATYGDGSLASGTPATVIPAYSPVGIIPIRTATLTVMAGFIQGIVIPPGSFRFAFNNGSGVALSATGANCVVKYRTYNLNLNS